MSGLLVGIHSKAAGIYSFRIFEKASSVGGRMGTLIQLPPSAKLGIGTSSCVLATSDKGRSVS